MTKFDVKCTACFHIWEEEKAYGDPEGDCPKCGSSFTKTILSGFCTPNTKQPYDYLATHREYKTIKSYANDKRKGGRG